MNLVESMTFAKPLRPRQVTTGRRRRRRAGQLCLSEIMTLLIWFHQSHYRNFSTSTMYVNTYAVRFLGWSAMGGRVDAFNAECSYLRQCQGTCTGISFIDSTPLAVCNPRRRHQHRLFDGAKTRGWFFGFKLQFSMIEANCSIWP